jgi:serine/threonine protein kinase
LQPEAITLSASGHSAAKSDIWALGVVLLEVMRRKDPLGFNEHDSNMILARIVTQPIPRLGDEKDPEFIYSEDCIHAIACW